MSTAEELFRTNVASLPRLAEESVSYSDQLEKAFDEFAALAAQVSATDRMSSEFVARLPIILQLSSALVSAHREAIGGRPDAAYAHFTAAMKIVGKEIGVLRSKPMSADDIGPLFRARRAAIGATIDRGGVFHIPFDQRHRVAPMRYSSLGVPMLYLGSSLYICWEEMGRPDFGDLWVASLRLSAEQRVSVLDLGWRPATVAGNFHLASHSPVGSPMHEVAMARAVLWPLHAACSFRKRYPTAPFVEEYVAPQLLTRFLVETGEFDGVRYFSNHVKSRGDALIPEAMNFVFPAVPVSNTGYSHHLCKKFEMTTPIPWNLVTALGPGYAQPQPVPRTGIGIVEIIPEHHVEYVDTEFAKVEGHLLAQRFAAVA